MPRLIKSLPKYRKHKASGQAVVTLDGKDFYLGPFNSQVSLSEYDRRVGEWQQNGRRLPAKSNERSLITIAEVLIAYWKFAEGYYVKNGKPTDELPGLKIALRFARKNYGDTLVSDFGPLALETIQQRMVEAGHSRNYINKNIGRIKRCFKWGVSKELVPVQVHQALSTVVGLRRGKTNAKETAPVAPVSDSVIRGALPFALPVVADMIRFQRLTGCRPGELFIVRPCDIDREDDVWCYIPDSHKTEHYGRNRAIFVGPKAQVILSPYLLRTATDYCFQRPKGGHFRRWIYSYYIDRACKKAFPPPETLSDEELRTWRKSHRWTPNQLRHTAATEFRKKFGLEAAQVLLGHSTADVTQIYAERDSQKAAEIMRQVG